MSGRRAQVEALGHRSARGMYLAASGAGHLASILDSTAGHVDHAAALVGRLDRPAVERAWSSAARPRRRPTRVLATFALGALSAIALSRLFRHVRTRQTPERDEQPVRNADWHVDRADDSWQVRDPRAEAPRSVHRTQADAIASAERALAAQGGGDLVVHALDGRPREVLHIAPV